MKKIYIFAASIAVPLMADAQSAIDGFRFSQSDMKGTARYMSMGGAFGALGGDLSSITTNPAGLGVYRRNEIGITMDLDLQDATSNSRGTKSTQYSTKFLLNNVGGVASWNLANNTIPNINVAFTYNRGASFNAHYKGMIPNLSNSLTNYIAGITDYNGVILDNVEATENNPNPYNPSAGYYAAPWLSVLGYNSYFITPTGDSDQPNWIGQWGTTTSGSGAFEVITSGGINEYNFAIGGNIANKVFWGLDFGVVDLKYAMTAAWGENLKNAVVDNPDGMENTSANWVITNYYNASGTGYNIKVGLIYRPIQELRLGLSFASPTWYSINESYLAQTKFNYPEIGIPNSDDHDDIGLTTTNDGEWGTNSYNFRTPWRLTASAAGVIGRSLILSADFEWQKYNKMRFYDGGGSGYYDYGFDGGFGYFDGPDYAPAVKASPSLITNDPWYATNDDIETYYKSSTAIRFGAEYRVTPRFSVRAGYAYVSSPVRNEAKDGSMLIYTSGTMPNYKMDNSTNYITCGLGYNFNNFYIDGAFVHKRMNSEYHAYTSDPAHPEIPSPTSKLSLNNNQIILSAGVRF